MQYALDYLLSMNRESDELFRALYGKLLAQRSNLNARVPAKATHLERMQ